MTQDMELAEAQGYVRFFCQLLPFQEPPENATVDREANISLKQELYKYGVPEESGICRLSNSQQLAVLRTLETASFPIICPISLEVLFGPEVQSDVVLLLEERPIDMAQEERSASSDDEDDGVSLPPFLRKAHRRLQTVDVQLYANKVESHDMLLSFKQNRWVIGPKGSCAPPWTSNSALQKKAAATLQRAQESLRDPSCNRRICKKVFTDCEEVPTPSFQNLTRLMGASAEALASGLTRGLESIGGPDHMYLLRPLFESG
ncbi:MAG: uncharacterized protein KVP18_000148 [Porospora cf. gigantea A]|uniref:uncharacterized protein n=1 Tax=Porospora cf. gigantea A TaxID=2853593 RepID=UPI00355AA4CC|nr:MAG: hypothetical protein KVP18_000148 [Porospora cf. gigantea A]